MTTNNYCQKDIISMHDFSRDDILSILNVAQKMKADEPHNLLQGKILASCFFEPSTRTRLSFEIAMKRLGGEVVGFTDSSSTSEKKGESLADSIRVIGDYSDAIVIRHPREGSARHAAEVTTTPVINGGDGANQHPTQTLLDLFSIQECQGRLDDLHIAWVGDLKYGRTVHSLVQACCHFGARMYFVSPPSLELPEALCEELKRHGIVFSFHPSIESIIHKLDILYMTRIQKERHTTEADGAHYILTGNVLEKAKKNLKVMHPLPRVDEIGSGVDASPFAYYFTQSKNGVPVRQALLAMILGRV